MNKLKLFIGVGLCGTLFTGCGFFDSLFGTTKQTSSVQKTEKVEVDCRPQDLKERLDKYYKENDSTLAEAAKYLPKNFTDISKYPFFNNYFVDANDKTKCDKEVIDRYNKIIKEQKSLPTTYAEEKILMSKLRYCDKMPDWLSKALDENINKNKDSDKKYIEARDLKKLWENFLNGELDFIEGRHRSISYDIIGYVYTESGGKDIKQARIKCRAMEEVVLKNLDKDSCISEGCLKAYYERYRDRVTRLKLEQEQ